MVRGSAQVDDGAQVRGATTTRSLAMLALGALVGLGLAGYGLFSAPAGDAAARLPGVLARVNQGQILQSDFRTQIETLYDVPFDKSTAQQRQQVLDSMIGEELLVQRGLELGLPATNATVREALVDAVNLQSTAHIDAGAPTDAQLRAYFGAHPERYMSSARPPAVPLSFADSAANVSADYKRDATRRARDEYVRFLRDKATVVIDAPLALKQP